MADSDRAETPPAPAPDDMHWGITYLREDIQDIRAESREFRAEVKAEFAEVRKEMREGESSLRAEMQAGDASVREEIVELRKRVDARFYWTIGLMASMMGAHAALTAALIKL